MCLTSTFNPLRGRPGGAVVRIRCAKPELSARLDNSVSGSAKRTASAATFPFARSREATADKQGGFLMGSYPGLKAWAVLYGCFRLRPISPPLATSDKSQQKSDRLLGYNV
jgi:hypothetical protein